MADEDEIDVLGDFSLDNLLSKNESGIPSCYDNSVLTSQNSELLSCDYSLNSQWLLENPTSNTDCWYTSAGTDFNTVDASSETNTSLGFDEVICTESKALDETGWTDEEKSSLLKGLEIFGRNSTNLSQFVGTKSPNQIKHYLKHHYKKNATNLSFAFNNVYNTVDITDKQSHMAHSNAEDIPSVFKMSDIIEDAQIPASIEEVIAAVSTAKPTVQNICKKSIHKKKICHSYKTHASKKFKYADQPVFNFNKKKIRPKLPEKSKKSFERKRIKSEKNVVIKEIDQVKNEYIPPVVLPVSSGEELIKIKKENSESESETEIEVDIDEDIEKVVKPEVNSVKEEVKEEKSIEQEIIPTVEENIPKDNEQEEMLNRRIKSMSDSVLAFLTNSDVPSEECILEEDVITEVEKSMHAEFFEGRPTKTPSRYLKIRNHIIDYWLENKPMYCTKTAVRQGLKNCGDVNCIGRIHQYLEQIGAINFGCEQINYVRPLINLIITSPTKEKPVAVHPQKLELVRPRMKKKYNNDGEGGYTMMHDENGEIIDTTVVNQDKQAKPRNRRQNIKLVYCKGFTDDNPAPFSVTLHISALLLIDMHAHSALIEVMGLLGGTFDQIQRVLHITRYVPCRGTDHSNTHCDMCPVSQSEASELLISEGVEVVGWFHSHPTFYPNPSLQDIDTQLNMQLYLSNEYKPFVGVILSPFRALATALVSEYRCLIVDKKENDPEDVGTPYKFQTNLNSDHLDVDLFLRYAADMFSAKSNVPKEFVVDFHKPYFQDTTMSYLEKLLASIKLHLARCSEINKMTCDAIVHGITENCFSSAFQQRINLHEWNTSEDYVAGIHDKKFPGYELMLEGRFGKNIVTTLKR